MTLLSSIGQALKSAWSSFYVQEKVRPGTGREAGLGYREPVEKPALAMNGVPRAQGCARLQGCGR